MELSNMTTNDYDFIANKVADILEQRGHIKQDKGQDAKPQAQVAQPAHSEKLKATTASGKK